jgi:hypothetical protein
MVVHTAGRHTLVDVAADLQAFLDKVRAEIAAAEDQRAA